MTLDTCFRIIDPTDVREVFDFGRILVGATDRHTWKHEGELLGNPTYLNHGDQGLPAWLMVHYGADGPLDDRWMIDEDDPDDTPRAPVAAIEVSFDTAYGYRGPGGMSCGQRHALYVAALGQWCERRGLAYSWHNEFAGEWHDSWQCAADELGAASDKARAWLWETVLPAIESEYGPVTP